MQKVWSRLQETVSLGRWAFPGMVVVGLVIAARLAGSLQSLEWLALDSYLRLRPAEPDDDRIVLVGFDSAALKQTGYPIPETQLTALLAQLQAYKPAVIGLHILPNQIALADGVGRLMPRRPLRNLIVSEQILPAANQIPPPSGFAAQQIGFIDIIPDGDDHLRRAILGTYDPIKSQTYKLSLTIQLVEKYLVSQNNSLALTNGIRDPKAMRFGTTELPRLLPNSGGYVNASTGNPQILLNFRSGPHPFRVLSPNDIKTGHVDPNWLRDRIIIVGITDPTIRPIIPTATDYDTNSLDIQAHAVSQIISAVLDGRSLLNTWPDAWEYLWIMVWGSVAVIWGRSKLSPQKKLMGIAIIQIGLMGVGYWLLISGWWIPVIPAALVWLLNGIGCTAFYKYDWVLRSRLKENQRVIEERQHTIEQTFDVIHNGPLQTLANLLRQIRDGNLSQAQLLAALENLNRDIRGIGEHLKQETLTQEDSLYLGNDLKVDLKLPVHELFFEVYNITLERPDIPRFATLKIACYFEPIEPLSLHVDHKRNLCRFLEEALCNVGKHANGATHLSVTGTQTDTWYTLQIKDNGSGIQSTVEGEGTKHARKVAARLGGKFQRSSLPAKGTLCELTFPLTKSWRL